MKSTPHGMEDPRQLLEGIEIFRGLSDHALKAMAISADSRIYHRGQLIVAEGQFGDRLFVVGGGSVDVIKSYGQPEEAVLAQLGEKQIFGEMCLIEGLVRSASVRASEPSLIYSMSNSSIHKLSRFYPEDYYQIILNVNRDLCSRLRKLDMALATRAA